MSRRNTYLSLMVLGTVITMIGGTGIFAVFTDRATTDTNTVISTERDRVAHIQLATATWDGINWTCSEYSDDLQTGLFDVDSYQPGEFTMGAYACLKNAGSAGASISLRALDLINSDPACTGDESSVDPTCGGGPGTGQLAGITNISVGTVSCATAEIVAATEDATLTSLTSSALAFPGPDLAPGGVVCFGINFGAPAGLTETQKQAAQTDKVTWRFAFDATANI